MVELYTAPFAQLVRRIFWEYEREGKIFDLPKSKFYQPSSSASNLDLSVNFHGERAATVVGPAAGPQSQLAQNLVLSWLAGSRILELKTVQINDQLQIPRPCIDATNVGYNIEWSQELRLAQSLLEYVKGSMLIEMLRAANIPSGTEGAAGDTVFDMSVGYDLAGIQSAPICQWLAQLRDARQLVEELRQQIPPEFAQYRDLPFKTHISNSITLSTFHGCPANEIERIVEFLLGELDVNTIIKLNPTLLGREAVEHLLHDVLGYQDIKVTQDAFDKDLQFDEALQICDRLGRLAASKGKKLGVKFSNTLVVRNHLSFFPKDETMYMSGAPLHIVTMNLVEKFRAAVGDDMPISFSAGIDQHNFPDAVAQGFVPVTTCTDLLRPGGYGRLPAYLNRLQQKMQAVNAQNIGDYVIKAEGHSTQAIEQVLQQFPHQLATLWPTLTAIQQTAIENWGIKLGQTAQTSSRPLADIFNQEIAELTTSLGLTNELALSQWSEAMARLYPAVVRRAGWLNTQTIVPRLTADPRYSHAKNSAIPRKIGSKLWLYDCINCDKCIPVCPNDANFTYEVAALEADCLHYQLVDEAVVSRPGRSLKIAKTHQIGNFADFCNECGNCDVFCPESGGPYLEKPRFFGTLAAMREHVQDNGCCFERQGAQDRAYGRFQGQEYTLTVDKAAGWAEFTDGRMLLKYDLETNQCQSTVKVTDLPSDYYLDSYYYYVLSSLLAGVLNSDKINYLNVAK